MANQQKSSGNKKAKQVKVHLKNVRASFLHCFVAQVGEDENGNPTKPAYTGHFLFDKEHPAFKEIRQAMVAVAKAKFGDANGVEVLKALMKKDKVCLRDGNSKMDPDGNVMEGYGGMQYLSARSAVKPKVVDRDRNVTLTEKDGRPYSGCYVNAIVAIWAQTGKFGKRINAQLQGVQFVKDGDAFGSGRAASADEFDSLEDEFSDDIPFDGDDDDLT